jgi:putative flavoprotein involved in K+ transport
VADMEHVGTVVIGGGQTGLMTGYELQQLGADFVILDANETVGDAWRRRWDSLTLFTPAHMNGLPGLRYPAKGDAYIGKDAFADFLAEYARTMSLPIRNGVRVTRLSRQGERFLVESERHRYQADNVIVAMADYQRAKLPNFAADLSTDITQLHAAGYRNPNQLQPGAVLIVGAGNSGADLAAEVLHSHETIFSGEESGVVPFHLESWFGRMIGTRLVRFAMVRVLNTATPMGRRARPKMLREPTPLIRVKPKELEAAGVRRVSRIAGIQDGRPITADGEILDVANVIWCTGYAPGFDWIDLPVFDEDGAPKHTRGIVATQPGLYFLGLFFLHSAWSETITGAPIDVRHVMRHLAKNRRVAQAFEASENGRA